MAQQGACCHDHNCDDHNCSSEWSLYKSVDVPKVWALNEAIEGSVRRLFRPWETRLDFSHVCESNEDDPELIVYIPFTSDVKIKSICVIGGPDGTSPSQMRAFTNRDDIDFSNVRDFTPLQEWALAEDARGELEYATRFARFQGVSNLTLHFPSNFGGDTTRIHFVGLKGEATQNKRDMVANVVYEVTPQPQDHKLPAESSAPQIL